MVKNKDIPFLKLLYFNIKVLFARRHYSHKVFCIGYNKTGTTSVGRAFEMMGYRNASFNRVVWRNWYLKGNYFKVLDYASKFDSFDDLPWLTEDMIPLLDKVFPHSKFVYLTREEEAWKKSLYNWTFKVTGTYPDIEKRLADFYSHRDFVMNYFNGRENDLLILDVSEEKSFEKLAAFLGKKAPQANIPHLHKT